MGERADHVGVATPNEFIEQFSSETLTTTYPFAAVDPSGPGALEKLDDAIDRGLRGVKLYPVLWLYDIREERFDPFYRKATNAGLVFLWHMGATPSPAGARSRAASLIAAAGPSG